MSQNCICGKLRSWSTGSKESIKVGLIDLDFYLQKNSSLLRNSQAREYEENNGVQVQRGVGDAKIRTHSPGAMIQGNQNEPRGFNSFKDGEMNFGRMKPVQARVSPDINQQPRTDLNENPRAKSLPHGEYILQEKRMTDVNGRHVDDSDYMPVSDVNPQQNPLIGVQRSLQRADNHYEQVKQENITEFVAHQQNGPIVAKQGGVDVREGNNLSNPVNQNNIQNLQYHRENAQISGQDQRPVNNSNRNGSPIHVDSQSSQVNGRNHRQSPVPTEVRDPSNNRGSNNSAPRPEVSRRSDSNPRQIPDNGPHYQHHQPNISEQESRQNSRYSEPNRNVTRTDVDPSYQYPLHQNDIRVKTRTDADQFYQHPDSQHLPVDAFNRQKTRTDADPFYEYPHHQNVPIDDFNRPITRTDVDPFYQHPAPHSVQNQSLYRPKSRTEADPFYHYPVANQIAFNDHNNARSRTDVEPFYNYPNAQPSGQTNPNHSRTRTDADPFYNYPLPEDSVHNQRLMDAQHRVSGNMNNYTLSSQQPGIDYGVITRDSSMNGTTTLINPYPQQFVPPLEHNQISQENRGAPKKSLNDTTILGDPNRRANHSPSPTFDPRKRNLTENYNYQNPNSPQDQSNPRYRVQTGVQQYYKYPYVDRVSQDADNMSRTQTDIDPFYQHPLVDNFNNPTIDRSRSRTDVDPFYNYPYTDLPFARDERDRTRTDVDPFYNYPQVNNNRMNNETSEMTSSFNVNRKIDRDNIMVKDGYHIHPTHSGQSYYRPSSNPINQNRPTTLTNPLANEDRKYSNFSPSNNIYNDPQKTNDPFNTYTDNESHREKRSIMAKPDQFNQSSRDYSRSEPFRRELGMNDTISTNNDQTMFDITRMKVNTTADNISHYGYSDTTEEDMFIRRNRLTDDALQKKNGSIYAPDTFNNRANIEADRFYGIINTDKNSELHKRAEIENNLTYNKKIVIEPEVINNRISMGKIIVYKVNSEGIPEEIVKQKKLGTEGAYMKRIKLENEMNNTEEHIVEEEFFFDNENDDKNLYELFIKQHGIEANEFVKRISRNRDSLYQVRGNPDEVNMLKKGEINEEFIKNKNSVQGVNFAKRTEKHGSQFDKPRDLEDDSYIKSTKTSTGRINKKFNLDEDTNYKRTNKGNAVEELSRKEDNKSETMNSKKSHANEEWKRYKQMEAAENNRRLKQDEERMNKTKNTQDELFNKRADNQDEQFKDVYKNNSDRYMAYPGNEADQFAKYSLKVEDRINRNVNKSAEIYKKAEKNFNENFANNRHVEEESFKKDKQRADDRYEKSQDIKDEQINKKNKSSDVKINKYVDISEEKVDKRKSKRESEYRKKNDNRQESYEKRKANTVMTILKPAENTEETIRADNRGTSEIIKTPNAEHKSVAIVDRRYRSSFNRSENFFKYVDVDDITYKKEKANVYSETLCVIDEFIVQNRLEYKVANLIIDQEEHEFVLKLLPQDSNSSVFEENPSNIDEGFESRFKILSLRNMDNDQIEHFIKRSKVIRAS